MRAKANVAAFNRDAARIGGYRYTDSSIGVARHFSNSRTSRAIAGASVFAGKSVLDVGCGDGVFTLELASLGVASVLGIDPAADAIASAEHRARVAGVSNASFRCCSVADLDSSFGHFDIAVMRGVLHHLAQPDAAVKATGSVCDEIIVLEPNGCNPVLKLIERFSAYHVEHEEQSFLPSTIDSWLKAADKQPIQRQVINLVPLFCPPWLAKTLKAIEPAVERLPLVRLIACGQYLVKAA